MSHEDWHEKRLMAGVREQLYFGSGAVAKPTCHASTRPGCSAVESTGVENTTQNCSNEQEQDTQLQQQIIQNLGDHNQTLNQVNETP
jgi:hypothetical protein